MLKGKNVNLRALKRSDIDSLLRWFDDPEVIQYVNFHLPMTEMAEEKYIENVATSSSDVVFIIEALDDDNRPIGTMGLHGINPKDQNCFIGIGIGEKSHWGKGYGTEATQLIIEYGFHQLNLHRIWASVLAYNERSLRMLKTLGFQEEGRQREAMYKNGEFHDIVIFGLLRDEWEKL